MIDHSDIDICLFRIADSLGSPEKMRVWLYDQGYTGSNFSSTRTDANQKTVGNYASTRLEGYLPASVFDQRVGFNHSIFDWILGVPPRNRDHFVNIGYSKLGKVVFVFSGRRGT